MTANSSAHSKTKKRIKPSKPYKGFPLFPHATGRWAKKIRGKTHYFGPWDDANAALELYLEQKDDLHAGRTPRTTSDGFTIRDLCNHFLTFKQSLVQTGEIVKTTFDGYYRTCDLLIKFFGKNRLVDDLRPVDFAKLRTHFTKNRGLVALGNQINRSRVVFNYAYNADFIDRPIKFGPAFKRPSKRALRIAKSKQPKRLFTPKQIHTLIDAAPIHLKAMILLGINCGLGNADIARMEFRMLTKRNTWLDYPRQKTGIERSCPLWKETQNAMKEYRKIRKTPEDEAHEHLIFITKYGGSWFKDTDDNPISNEFRKLSNSTKTYRQGLTFYALRHTFETVGGESRDQVAVDHMMGHSRDDMASVYRQRISSDRLIRVSNFVHDWLFTPEKKNETEES